MHSQEPIFEFDTQSVHLVDTVSEMASKDRPGYVGVRLTLSQRKFLDEAAEVDHRRLSDFVRLAALKQAEELLGRLEKPEKPKKTKEEKSKP